MLKYPYFIESAVLGVENPLNFDAGRPITEAAVADNISVKDVRAVFPLVRAINSSKLTRNFTFYPAETLIGQKKGQKPTGYASFVTPHAKPVIREHKLQGMWEDADIPMGRILWAGYSRKKENLIPAENGVGYFDGDGCLKMVCSITEPEDINRVLGGQYHTVSIGSVVEQVFESISGLDLVALRHQGKEYPDYEKGKTYTIDGKEKLCYWTMKGMGGNEISFVNAPSDTHAGVENPDIGEKGIRLLLGEKPVGKKEFAFFDAITHEKIIQLSEEEFYAFAPGTPLIDSIKPKEYYWFNYNSQDITESFDVMEGFGSMNTEGVIPTPADHVIPAVGVEKFADFKKDDHVTWEELGRTKTGQVLSCSLNKVTIRPFTTEKDGKLSFASFICPVDRYKVSLLSDVNSENTAENTENITENEVYEFKSTDISKLTLTELAKIRAFFLENFSPHPKYKQKLAPLLEMKAVPVWTISQYEKAYTFMLSSSNLTEKEERLKWGLKPLGSAEQTVSNIISEVINGK